MTDYGKVLLEGGTVVVSGGSMGQIFQCLVQGPWLSMGPHRYRSVMGRPDANILGQLSRWMVEGTVKPVVDRVFPLERGAEAFTWLKSGQSRGKVVVTV